MEEFATECSNSAHAMADHWLGMHPLELGGSDEQKKRFLPELRTKLIAFSLTEPESGSDSGAMKTRAVLKGDKYVLNGTKCFCTDGGQADYITIFAKTDPAAGTRGISAFIVPRLSPGLTIGRVEDQMGMRGTRAVEIILEDCEVPAANRIGNEGDGFRLAMKTFNFSRPLDGILAIGIAQGSLNAAKEYAKTRKQFGQTISQFQAIQFMLADMAMEIEAGRHLTYRAASLIDEGTPDPMLGSMAKCFDTDVAMKVCTNAIQVFGGYGYMKDFPVERRFRDAKLMQIVEGTNQVQRVIIARALLER
jgi:acyl-CoA dehydrogenase